MTEILKRGGISVKEETLQRCVGPLPDMLLSTVHVSTKLKTLNVYFASLPSQCNGFHVYVSECCGEFLRTSFQR